MKTKIVKADDLEGAVSFLNQGEPVAFPTETVYGLGAPVFNEAAIEKIFFIKKRPSDNPLIVHISSLDQVEDLAENIPPLFYQLAAEYFPGPLTLVVPKKSHISSLISAGLPSIAIRMPSNKIANDLISKTGPLVAPSANLSGKPSPTTAQAVLEDLEGKIPVVVDGGACLIGIESTVLSLLEQTPTLLRPGTISKQELEAFLGLKVKEATKTTAIASPGMKYRHYSPRAKVKLVFQREMLKGEYILSVQPQEGMHFLSEQTLYELLREADRKGVQEVLIDCSNELIQKEGLMNRLKKASS